MQIVIDIPEEVKYKVYAYGLSLCPSDKEQLINAIMNGKQLPKGHGDLIDVDDIRVIELEDSLHIIRHEKGDEIDVYIDAPTIIEADKVESEEG